MASNLSKGNNPPGGDLTSTKLPEHINGFIDLEILVDMHMSLSQSEKSDDFALAAWIEFNYLQEPLSEMGRPIRDAEGFANLDKAYRRVRQLTGRAKDKWPFFDKNWRKLSSTVVKNAILGIDALDKTRSDTNGQGGGTPISNGFDGQHNQALEATNLQITSGANNCHDQNSQKQNSLQPVEHSLPLQKATEQETHHQEQSLTSETGGNSRDTLQKDEAGAVALEGAVNGVTPSGAALREAGAGKVRGPHGRYVNNNKSPPPVGKKGPKLKQAKKTRIETLLESEGGEDGFSTHKGVKKPKNILEITSISPNGNVEIVRMDSEPLRDAHSISPTLNDFQSPVSTILAAEAEAVPSNLDRLPPGFTPKKRKSESSIDRGGLKRARGSRGGVLGRPRKSETLAEKSLPASEESAEVEHTPAHPEFPVETSLKPITRRSSRRSAASALESSAPWDPTADVLLNGARHKQTDDYNISIASLDANAASNGGHRSTATPAGVKQRSKDITKEIVKGASPRTVSGTFPSQSPVTRAVGASVKHKKRVSFSPEDKIEDVTFFARIVTSAGTKDVTLLEEDLRTEVNLVKRYAAWQKAGNTDATFEVFKNIVQFTR